MFVIPPVDLGILTVFMAHSEMTPGKHTVGSAYLRAEQYLYISLIIPVLDF